MIYIYIYIYIYGFLVGQLVVIDVNPGRVIYQNPWRVIYQIDVNPWRSLESLEIWNRSLENSLKLYFQNLW
jgi:hypothetical protein